MNENEILSEIHRVREDIARECGYDVRRLYNYVREREREAAKRGVEFVSPAPREKETAYALREEPPRQKKGKRP